MRRTSTLAEKEHHLPHHQMDFVYHNPPSPTCIYETSTLYSLQATRFAGPSAEQEQISRDERPLRQVPNLDYLPDATSDPKESENGEMYHEIGDDAGQQPEEGDLTLAFGSLTMGVGGVFEESGDQYDEDGRRCAPVYPDSLGNIG